MEKSWALGIVIGASLSGGFSSAVGSAREKFNTLGREIKDLGSQRGLIERFEKDAAALEKTRNELGRTQKRVAELKLELRKNPDDAGLARELEKTQGQAGRLGTALERQRAQLRQSKQAMHDAGVEVGQQAAHYHKLGDAIDRAREKQVRLGQVLARKNAAAGQLSDMRGQALGVGGAVYGAARLVGEAQDAQYELRMFGNIANLTDEQLSGVRLQLKGISTDTQQKPGALLEALNTLSAKGLDPGRALASLPIIGKTATATGADINDLAKTVYSLLDAMQLSPDELPQALDMLAQAGKAGSFELKDMAQYFPMLTAQARSLGLTGKEGIATLGSALQVAMKGASDPAVAANNFQNFLAKITAPETIAKFEKFGVNIEEVMKNAAASGKNPIEEAIKTIQGLTGGDKFRIGELFGDMQVNNFLTPMLQNMQEFERIKNESLRAKGVVDVDFARIAATGKIQTEAFAIAVGQLGDSFATTLMPAVNRVLSPLAAAAGWAGTMIERFPWLGHLVGGVAVGVAGFAIALGIVTAATWMWNAALLANPIGLAIAAIAGAAALVISFWGPITEFFAGLWGGIKAIFAEGVVWLTAIWEASPLGLLFKAGQMLAGWAGGGMSGGASLAAGGAATLPAAMPLAMAGSGTSISAPITINPSPGMNAADVANAVDQKLRERESQAAARSRGALYD